MRNILLLVISFAALMGSAFAIDISACGTLSAPGTYTLTKNITANKNANCLNVTAADVTIDCNGYQMTGRNSLYYSGIYSTKDRTKVQNCIIISFIYGVNFQGVKDGVVENTRINVSYGSTGAAGAWNKGGNYARMTNCTIGAKGQYTPGTIGFSIENSTITSDNYACQSPTRLVNSNVTGGWAGVTLGAMTGPYIAGSVITGGQQGIYLSATRNALIENNVITSGYPVQTNGVAALVVFFPNGGNVIRNNTLISSKGKADLVYLNGGTGNKTVFYWNNFTKTSGMYIRAYNPTYQNVPAYLNASVGGHQEGNVYYNVMNGAVAIQGNLPSIGYPALYVGSAGAGYPYNNAHSQGKISMFLSDYAPLTPNAGMAVQMGNLIVNATPANGGSATGTAYNFTVPSVRNITAVANANYTFANWSISGNCTIANASAANTTVTVSNGTCYASAIFIYTPPPVGSLIVDVSPPGSGSASGTIYNVTVPFSGPVLAANIVGGNYTFAAWSLVGNCTVANATSGSTTVTVNSGTCYATANFALIPKGSLIVSATPVNGGTTTGTSYNFTVPKTLPITAAANANYTFANWSISGNCTIANGGAQNTTVTVNGGTCYATAIFIYTPPATGNLIVNATLGGVAGSSQYNFTVPATLPIWANASANYTFLYWNVSGNCSVANASAAVTTVTVNGGTCYATAYFNYTPPAPQGCVCGVLSVPNYVCNVTEDLTSTGTCFDVNATNVTILCNGHSITGSNATGSAGIFSSAAKTNVKSCQIGNFMRGIYFDGADGGTIQGSNASTSYPNSPAIYLLDSDNTNISNVRGTATSGTGIYLESSSYNKINGSLGASSAGMGINIQSGSGNQITGTNGTSISQSGIGIDYSSNNTIAGSVGISDLWAGIFLFSSQNNTVLDSAGASNLSYGLYLVYSQGNLVMNSNGSGVGINMISSSGNTIANAVGSSSLADHSAITIGSSSSNIIANSTFSSASNVTAWFVGSTSNTFYNNTLESLTNEGYLLRLDPACYNNTFYWNNFTQTGANYIYDSEYYLNNNFYNTTINGKPEGNIYGNVMNGAVAIQGNQTSSGFPNLYIGVNGTGHPYSAATAQGKIVGLAVDYAPLTPNYFNSTQPETGNLIVNATLGGVAGNSQYNFTVPATLPVWANANVNYTFAAWNASGNCTIANASAAVTTITVNSGTCYATAYFNYTPPAPQGCVCGVLNVPNYVCNVTEDLNSSGNCFTVTAPNVTILCNGHLISGANATGSWGINSTSNLTVARDCRIYGFDQPVIYKGGLGLISNLSAAAGQNYYGVWLQQGANGNTMRDSAINSSYNAAIMVEGSGNTISGVVAKAYANNGIALGGVGTSGNKVANSSISITSSGVAINVVPTTTGNSVYNNTIYAGGTGNGLLASGANNTFYWNNFTNIPGYYISSGAANQYSGMVNGRLEGNIYHNVVNGSVQVQGNVTSSGFPSLYIGVNGTGYPYSAANSQGKIVGSAVDYAPLTPSYFNNSSVPPQGCVCGVLNVPNYVCNVTQDLNSTGTCFTVGAANVTILCNGHSISGSNQSGSNGIYSSRARTIVKDCVLRDYYEGIYFNGAAQGSISNTTVISAIDAGYRFDNVNLSTISNSSSSAAIGVYLQSSPNNILSNVRANGTTIGIDMVGSDYNTVSGSSGTRNGGGNNGAGIVLYASQHNTVANSTGAASTLPGLWLDGGSNGNVISNFTGTSDSDDAIRVWSGIGNTIINSAGTSSLGNGIALMGGSGNTVINSAGTTNMGIGIDIGSDGNIIANSTGISNGSSGMRLWNGAGNIVSNSVAAGNTSGIYFILENGSSVQNSQVSTNYYGAVILAFSYGNTITNSTINGNGAYAVQFDSNGVENANNLFVGNRLLSATAHVWVNGQSSSNTFYWNNFTATSGYYIQDLNGSNFFNATVNGKPEGNIYANVISGAVAVQGNQTSSGFPPLYIGMNGTGYPYSAATAQGKIIGSAVDYAPLTPFYFNNSSSPPQGCVCGMAIYTPNYFCNVTQDLVANGTCLYANASNVTIECNGHSITGVGTGTTLGIFARGSGFAARNCRLNGLDYGLWLESVTEGNVSNLTINSSIPYDRAFYMNGSSYNSITGVRISALAEGFTASNSNYNNITSLDAVTTQTGNGSVAYPLSLFRSNYNRLVGVNGTSSNQYSGMVISNSSYNVLEGCAGTINDSAPSNIGGTAGINLGFGSNGNAFLNTKANGTFYDGLRIENSDGNTFTGCTITGQSGMYLGYSDSNVFDGCTITRNGAGNEYSELTSLFYSNSTTIKSSQITGNGTLWLIGANNNTIANNTISSTGGVYYGAALSIGALDSLQLDIVTSNNLIANNTFESNLVAVALKGAGANNTLYWNNFSNSGFYINDETAGNYYNATINGKPEGNIYANVMNGSVQVQGNVSSSGFPSLYIGMNGTGYPYSAATAQGKVLGSAVDYAPLTPNYLNNSSPPPQGCVCGVLNVPNYVCNVTQDLYNSDICFNVQAYNVTILCNGHTINGGIYSNQNRTSIIGCNISSDWPHAVMLNWTSNGLISGVSAESTTDAIKLVRSTNTTIINSDAYSDGYTGIRFEYSSSNSIINTNATANSLQGIIFTDNSNNNQIINSKGVALGNQPGIWLHDSSNNLVKDSVASSNTGNALYISGSGSGANNNVVVNNTLVSNSTLLALDTAANNTFYWNNFTQTSGYYIYDNSYAMPPYLNRFNTTINGKGEGNIYANVMNGSVQIQGNQTSGGYPSLYLGKNGTGYPYKQSTSQGKIYDPYAEAVDYAPLTPNYFSQGTNLVQNCSCGVLSIPNTYCNVTQDQSSTGTCFNVSATNVTIECNWFAILGVNTSYAVYSNQQKTTVNRCHIGYYWAGVGFDGATNGTISNVEPAMTQAVLYGILLTSSSYNSLVNITAYTYTAPAVVLRASTHNTLSGISAVGSSAHAIVLEAGSDYNNVTGTNGTSNAYGSGILLNQSNYNLLSGARGTAQNMVGLHLLDSNGNTLSGCSGASWVMSGIRLANSSNNQISWSNGTNNAYLNDHGIDLYQSSNNNNISNSIATNGMYLSSSSGNRVQSTRMASSSSPVALGLAGAGNNVFVGNVLIGSSTLLSANSLSSGNAFYWNNFTSTPGYYISDDGSNTYGATVNGRNEGNVYANVMNGAAAVQGNVSSAGFPLLYIGMNGSSYPYSAATSLGKIAGNAVDYAPLTPYYYAGGKAPGMEMNKTNETGIAPSAENGTNMASAPKPMPATEPRPKPTIAPAEGKPPAPRTEPRPSPAITPKIGPTPLPTPAITPKTEPKPAPSPAATPAPKEAPKPSPQITPKAEPKASPSSQATKPSPAMASGAGPARQEAPAKEAAAKAPSNEGAAGKQ